VQIILRQRRWPANHPSEPAPHRVAKVGNGASAALHNRTGLAASVAYCLLSAGGQAGVVRSPMQAVGPDGFSLGQAHQTGILIPIT